MSAFTPKVETYLTGGADEQMASEKLILSFYQFLRACKQEVPKDLGNKYDDMVAYVSGVLSKLNPAQILPGTEAKLETFMGGVASSLVGEPISGSDDAVAFLGGVMAASKMEAQRHLQSCAAQAEFLESFILYIEQYARSVSAQSKESKKFDAIVKGLKYAQTNLHALAKKIAPDEKFTNVTVAEATKIILDRAKATKSNDMSGFRELVTMMRSSLYDAADVRKMAAALKVNTDEIVDLLTRSKSMPHEIIRKLKEKMVNLTPLERGKYKKALDKLSELLHASPPAKLEGAAEELPDPTMSFEGGEYLITKEIASYVARGLDSDLDSRNFIEKNQEKLSAILASVRSIDFSKINMANNIDLVNDFARAMIELNNIDMRALVRVFSGYTVHDDPTSSKRNMYNGNLWRSFIHAPILRAISLAEKLSALVPTMKGFVTALRSWLTFLEESESAFTTTKPSVFSGGQHQLEGGLEEVYLKDVVNKMLQKINIDRMFIGLNQSKDQLDGYVSHQADMMKEIIGRHIQRMTSIFSSYLSDLNTSIKTPVSPELLRRVISDNIDGFVQLQRAAEALDEMVRTEHVKIVKNPHRVTQLIELLKEITIDPYAFGDFKKSRRFIDHFHIEAFGRTANTTDDFHKYSPLWQNLLRLPGLDDARITNALNFGAGNMAAFTGDPANAPFGAATAPVFEVLAKSNDKAGRDAVLRTLRDLMDGRSVDWKNVTDVEPYKWDDFANNAYIAIGGSSSDPGFTPFPVSVETAMYSEVTTLALASTKGDVKASNIHEKAKDLLERTGEVNHYHGSREFPAKVYRKDDVAIPQYNWAVHDNDNNARARMQVVDAENKWIENPDLPRDWASIKYGAGIQSAGGIPRSIKFLDKDGAMDMYESAKECLEIAVGIGGTEEVGVLKNFLSVFDKITASYDGENKSKYAMNVAQIYTAIKLFIANTTMYPIMMKIADKYICVGIGLREFGKDIVYIGQDRTRSSYDYTRIFRASTRAYNKGELDARSRVSNFSLDLRNDGGDQRPFRHYDNPNSAGANITELEKDNADELEKYLAEDNIVRVFYEHDTLLVMMIKSMFTKIMGIVAMYNIVNLRLENNMDQNRIRAIYGGARDPVYGELRRLTPTVVPENTEAYIRLFILCRFYKNIMFTDKYENKENSRNVRQLIAAKYRFTVLPIGDSNFDPLLALIFIDNWGNLSADSHHDTKDMFDSSLGLGKFVSEVNRLMAAAKGANSGEKCQFLVGELVKTVNARYGIAGNEDIHSIMDKSKKLREEPVDFFDPSDLDAHKDKGDRYDFGQNEFNKPVPYRPAKILDGEFDNQNPMTSTVPSDLAGPVFEPLVIPVMDKKSAPEYQTEWLTSIIYSFREMLDEYTSKLQVALDKRVPQKGAESLSELGDRKSSLHFRIAAIATLLRRDTNDRDRMTTLAEQLKNLFQRNGSFDVDPVVFSIREFVIAPLSLLFRIYSRLYAYAKIFGDKKGSVPLNRNLNLYNLQSVLSDLVPAHYSHDGRVNLDFTKLGLECTAMLRQASHLYQTLRLSIPSGDKRKNVDGYLSWMINVHYGLFNNDGVLDSIKFDDVKMNLLVDYDERPSILPLKHRESLDDVSGFGKVSSFADVFTQFSRSGLMDESFRIFLDDLTADVAADDHAGIANLRGAGAVAAMNAGQVQATVPAPATGLVRHEENFDILHEGVALLARGNAKRTVSTTLAAYFGRDDAASTPFDVLVGAAINKVGVNAPPQVVANVDLSAIREAGNQAIGKTGDELMLATSIDHSVMRNRIPNRTLVANAAATQNLGDGTFNDVLHYDNVVSAINSAIASFNTRVNKEIGKYSYANWKNHLSARANLTYEQRIDDRYIVAYRAIDQAPLYPADRALVEAIKRFDPIVVKALDVAPMVDAVRAGVAGIGNPEYWISELGILERNLILGGHLSVQGGIPMTNPHIHTVAHLNWNTLTVVDAATAVAVGAYAEKRDGPYSSINAIVAADTYSMHGMMSRVAMGLRNNFTAPAAAAINAAGQIRNGRRGYTQIVKPKSLEAFNRYTHFAQNYMPNAALIDAMTSHRDINGNANVHTNNGALVSVDNQLPYAIIPVSAKEYIERGLLRNVRVTSLEGVDIIPSMHSIPRMQNPRAIQFLKALDELHFDGGIQANINQLFPDIANTAGDGHTAQATLAALDYRLGNTGTQGDGLFTPAAGAEIQAMLAGWFTPATQASVATRNLLENANRVAGAAASNDVIDEYQKDAFIVYSSIAKNAIAVRLNDEHFAYRAVTMAVVMAYCTPAEISDAWNFTPTDDGNATQVARSVLIPSQVSVNVYTDSVGDSIAEHGQMRSHLPWADNVSPQSANGGRIARRGDIANMWALDQFFPGLTTYTRGNMSWNDSVKPYSTQAEQIANRTREYFQTGTPKERNLGGARVFYNGRGAIPATHRSNHVTQIADLAASTLFNRVPAEQLIDIVISQREQYPLTAAVVQTRARRGANGHESFTDPTLGVANVINIFAAHNGDSPAVQAFRLQIENDIVAGRGNIDAAIAAAADPLRPQDKSAIILAMIALEEAARAVTEYSSSDCLELPYLHAIFPRPDSAKIMVPGHFTPNSRQEEGIADWNATMAAIEEALQEEPGNFSVSALKHSMLNLTVRCEEHLNLVKAGVLDDYMRHMFDQSKYHLAPLSNTDDIAPLFAGMNVAGAMAAKEQRSANLINRLSENDKLRKLYCMLPVAIMAHKMQGDLVPPNNANPDLGNEFSNLTEGNVFLRACVESLNRYNTGLGLNWLQPANMMGPGTQITSFARCLADRTASNDRAWAYATTMTRPFRNNNVAIHYPPDNRSATQQVISTMSSYMAGNGTGDPRYNDFTAAWRSGRGNPAWSMLENIPVSDVTWSLQNARDNAKSLGITVQKYGNSFTNFRGNISDMLSGNNAPFTDAAVRSAREGLNQPAVVLAGNRIPDLVLSGIILSTSVPIMANGLVNFHENLDTKENRGFYFDDRDNTNVVNNQLQWRHSMRLNAYNIASLILTRSKTVANVSNRGIVYDPVAMTYTMAAGANIGDPTANSILLMGLVGARNGFAAACPPDASTAAAIPTFDATIRDIYYNNQLIPRFNVLTGLMLTDEVSVLTPEQLSRARQIHDAAYEEMSRHAAGVIQEAIASYRANYPGENDRAESNLLRDLYVRLPLNIAPGTSAYSVALFLAAVYYTFSVVAKSTDFVARGRAAEIVKDMGKEDMVLLDSAIRSALMAITSNSTPAISGRVMPPTEDQQEILDMYTKPFLKHIDEAREIGGNTSSKADKFRTRVSGFARGNELRGNDQFYQNEWVASLTDMSPDRFSLTCMHPDYIDKRESPDEKVIKMVLEFPLLNLHFAPKNIYLLFEYVAVMMYKKLFEEHGIGLTKLFYEPAQLLATMGNADVNSVELAAGLSMLERFQPDRPLSDKVIALYTYLVSKIKTKTGEFRDRFLASDISELSDKYRSDLRELLPYFMLLIRHCRNTAEVQLKMLTNNRIHNAENVPAKPYTDPAGLDVQLQPDEKEVMGQVFTGGVELADVEVMECTAMANTGDEYHKLIAPYMQTKAYLQSGQKVPNSMNEFAMTMIAPEADAMVDQFARILDRIKCSLAVQAILCSSSVKNIPVDVSRRAHFTKMDRYWAHSILSMFGSMRASAFGAVLDIQAAKLSSPAGREDVAKLVNCYRSRRTMIPIAVEGTPELIIEGDNYSEYCQTILDILNGSANSEAIKNLARGSKKVDTPHHVFGCVMKVARHIRGVENWTQANASEYANDVSAAMLAAIVPRCADMIRRAKPAQGKPDKSVETEYDAKKIAALFNRESADMPNAASIYRQAMSIQCGRKVTLYNGDVPESEPVEAKHSFDCRLCPPYVKRGDKFYYRIGRLSYLAMKSQPVTSGVSSDKLNSMAPTRNADMAEYDREHMSMAANRYSGAVMTDGCLTPEFVNFANALYPVPGTLGSASTRVTARDMGIADAHSLVPYYLSGVKPTSPPTLVAAYNAAQKGKSDPSLIARLASDIQAAVDRAGTYKADVQKRLDDLSGSSQDNSLIREAYVKSIQDAGFRVNRGSAEELARLEPLALNYVGDEDIESTMAAATDNAGAVGALMAYKLATMAYGANLENAEMAYTRKMEPQSVSNSVAANSWMNYKCLFTKSKQFAGDLPKEGIFRALLGEGNGRLLGGEQAFKLLSKKKSDPLDARQSALIEACWQATRNVPAPVALLSEKDASSPFADYIKAVNTAALSVPGVDPESISAMIEVASNPGKLYATMCLGSRGNVKIAAALSAPTELRSVAMTLSCTEKNDIGIEYPSYQSSLQSALVGLADQMSAYIPAGTGSLIGVWNQIPWSVLQFQGRRLKGANDILFCAGGRPISVRTFAGSCMIGIHKEGGGYRLIVPDGYATGLISHYPVGAQLGVSTSIDRPASFSGGAGEKDSNPIVIKFRNGHYRQVEGPVTPEFSMTSAAKVGTKQTVRSRVGDDVDGIANRIANDKYKTIDPATGYDQQNLPAGNNTFAENNGTGIRLAGYSGTEIVDRAGDGSADVSEVGRESYSESKFMPVGRTIEHAIARARNLIKAADEFLKAMSSTYAEVAAPSRYMSNAFGKSAPISFAIDLIPALFNTVRRNSEKEYEVDNVKSSRLGEIRADYPLGLHCANVHDMVDLVGSRRDMLRMVSIFLHHDKIDPIVGSEFSAISSLMANPSVASILSGVANPERTTMFANVFANLSKYLYELEIKSHSSTAFSELNNLTLPKHHAVVKYNRKIAPVDKLYGKTLNPNGYRCKSAEISMMIALQDMALRGTKREGRDNDPPQYKKLFDYYNDFVAEKYMLGSAAEIGNYLEYDSFENDRMLKYFTCDNKICDEMDSVELESGDRMLYAENILDTGFWPIDIHAMMREIPLANMYNNNYSFDRIVEWLVSNNRAPDRYEPNKKTIIEAAKLNYFKRPQGSDMIPLAPDYNAQLFFNCYKAGPDGVHMGVPPTKIGYIGAGRYSEFRDLNESAPGQIRAYAAYSDDLDRSNRSDGTLNGDIRALYKYLLKRAFIRRMERVGTAGDVYGIPVDEGNVAAANVVNPQLCQGSIRTGVNRVAAYIGANSQLALANGIVHGVDARHNEVRTQADIATVGRAAAANGVANVVQGRMTVDGDRAAKKAADLLLVGAAVVRGGVAAVADRTNHTYANYRRRVDGKSVPQVSYDANRSHQTAIAAYLFDLIMCQRRGEIVGGVEVYDEFRSLLGEARTNATNDEPSCQYVHWMFNTYAHADADATKTLQGRMERDDERVLLELLHGNNPTSISRETLESAFAFDGAAYNDIRINDDNLQDGIARSHLMRNYVENKLFDGSMPSVNVYFFKVISAMAGKDFTSVDDLQEAFELIMDKLTEGYKGQARTMNDLAHRVINKLDKIAEGRRNLNGRRLAELLFIGGINRSMRHGNVYAGDILNLQENSSAWGMSASEWEAYQLQPIRFSGQGKSGIMRDARSTVFRRTGWPLAKIEGDRVVSWNWDAMLPRNFNFAGVLDDLNDFVVKRSLFSQGKDTLKEDVLQKATALVQFNVPVDGFYYNSWFNGMRVAATDITYGRENQFASAERGANVNANGDVVFANPNGSAAWSDSKKALRVVLEKAMLRMRAAQMLEESTLTTPAGDYMQSIIPVLAIEMAAVATVLNGVLNVEVERDATFTGQIPAYAGGAEKLAVIVAHQSSVDYGLDPNGVLRVPIVEADVAKNTTIEATIRHHIGENNGIRRNNDGDLRDDSDLHDARAAFATTVGTAAGRPANMDDADNDRITAGLKERLVPNANSALNTTCSGQSNTRTLPHSPSSMAGADAGHGFATVLAAAQPLDINTPTRATVAAAMYKTNIDDRLRNPYIGCQPTGVGNSNFIEYNSKEVYKLGNEKDGQASRFKLMSVDAGIFMGQSSLLRRIVSDYYVSQRIASAEATESDLHHGRDKNCQQPHLAVELYVDRLFNEFAKKMQAEFKEENRPRTGILGILTDADIN